MTKGYVKVYRKLRDNPIYKNSKAVHILIECLFRASHKDHSIFLERQRVALKSGQFCMGYREFSESVSLSVSVIYYWFDVLEVERILERKSSPSGTIVTILNWDEYQKVERKVERKKNASRTQIELNKNGKNGKNGNNIYKGTLGNLKLSEILNKYIDLINSNTKKNFRETSGRKEKLKARLKNYSYDDILLALTNMFKDPFYKGKNDRGWVANPDFLIRNDEQVDRFINIGSKKPNNFENEKTSRFNNF